MSEFKLFCMSFYSLTHSLTHSFNHSLIHSLTQPLTHSLTHSHTQPSSPLTPLALNTQLSPQTQTQIVYQPYTQLSGVDKFTYSLTSEFQSKSLTATSEIVLNVIGVNDAPVVVVPTALTAVDHQVCVCVCVCVSVCVCVCVSE